MKLKILDVLGREVIELVNDIRGSGSYEVRWDGRNTDGKIAASGTYFYQIIANGYQLSKKLQLLK